MRSLKFVWQLNRGQSSSCEMTILRNRSHGEIIRVCMRIFTTAPANKKIQSNSQQNTSPYFHRTSLVVWPLTMSKRVHFSEISFSRFPTPLHPYTNLRFLLFFIHFIGRWQGLLYLEITSYILVTVVWRVVQYTQTAANRQRQLTNRQTGSRFAA